MDPLINKKALLMKGMTWKLKTITGVFILLWIFFPWYALWMFGLGAVYVFSVGVFSWFLKLIKSKKSRRKQIPKSSF